MCVARIFLHFFALGVMDIVVSDLVFFRVVLALARYGAGRILIGFGCSQQPKQVPHDMSRTGKVEEG